MYEDLTHVEARPKRRSAYIAACAKASRGGRWTGTNAAQAHEDIRIFGNVSLEDVLRAIKNDASEKEVPTEITLAVLHDFFADIVGRKIAVDGALINFHPMLPETIKMEI